MRSFVRTRPAALAMAYNGGSIGGVIFSPLWVLAVGALGFANAAAAIGLAMAFIMWVLADLFFSRTPQQMGLAPDGDAPGTPATTVTLPLEKPLPGALLRTDWGLMTLSAGMALGLFAQIGLTAHLFSLLVPALGAQRGDGIGYGHGRRRSHTPWLAHALGTDRRLLACTGYAAQLAGSIVLIAAAGASVPLLPALVTRPRCRHWLRRSNSSRMTYRVQLPSW
jgi:hypothetical protein